MTETGPGAAQPAGRLGRLTDTSAVKRLSHGSTYRQAGGLAEPSERWTDQTWADVRPRRLGRARFANRRTLLRPVCGVARWLKVRALVADSGVGRSENGGGTDMVPMAGVWIVDAVGSLASTQGRGVR